MPGGGGGIRAKVTYRMWVENDGLVEEMRAKARLVPRGSTVGNQLRSFGAEAKFNTNYADFVRRGRARAVEVGEGRPWRQGQESLPRLQGVRVIVARADYAISLAA